MTLTITVLSNIQSRYTKHIFKDDIKISEYYSFSLDYLNDQIRSFVLADLTKKGYNLAGAQVVLVEGS